jgi:hypothetical protein
MSAAEGVRAAALVAARAVDDNDVSPGVIGFVVVALLGVATWLLMRSMTRQLKKIDLPDDDQPDDGQPDDGTDERGSADG